MDISGKRTAKQLQEFGSSLIGEVGEAPFGALSKSELEFSLFQALVHAGIIDLEAPLFEIAKDLEVTPTKASNLIFSYRMRAKLSPAAATEELASAMKFAGVAENGKDVVFIMEDRYWREELTARLKAHSIYTDTSFNRERVVMDGDALVRFLQQEMKTQSTKLLSEIDAKKKALKGRRTAGTTASVVGDIAKGVLTGSIANGSLWQLISMI